MGLRSVQQIFNDLLIFGVNFESVSSIRNGAETLALILE